MVDCIVVNGDSYSAKIKNRVYSDFLAEQLNIPVINIARQGSNNDRIRRTSIEKLLEIKGQYKKPLLIVGWSFIRRIEVWYYGNHSQVIHAIPDRENKESYQQPRFVTLDTLTSLNQATLEQKCLVNEDLFVHKQLTDFYTSLYMFAHTVESLGAELFCFSAAKNTEIPVDSFPYIESLQQVKWCASQKNIHQLHEFCIMQWAKNNDPAHAIKTGHLSEYGHQHFADELISWLNNVGYKIRNIDHV